MSVKSRMLVLNKRMQDWLNNRGILTTENETTTSLVDKIINQPLLFNQMSLMPTAANTIAANYDGIPGCDIQFLNNGTVKYTSNISGREWPHIETTYNHRVQVPNAKLFVDAEHTDRFNMMIKLRRRDQDGLFYIRLSELMGLGQEDIEAPNTTIMANLGSYLVNECDLVSPPPVSKKYDLLKTVTQYEVDHGL